MTEIAMFYGQCFKIDEELQQKFYSFYDCEDIFVRKRESFLNRCESLKRFRKNENLIK